MAIFVSFSAKKGLNSGTKNFIRKIRSLEKNIYIIRY
jgi:hypothetical protein